MAKKHSAPKTKEPLAEDLIKGLMDTRKVQQEALRKIMSAVDAVGSLPSPTANPIKIKKQIIAIKKRSK